MKAYFYCLVAALLGAAVAWGQQREAPRGRTEAEDGVEVLTRGPVHEAFAETISFDPQPGVVVEKPAPEAIEELPPEQKPEGANVDWIPGYWAWDDERSDYLWVSGIWRSLPPGRQWVSGYWANSGGGSQWTSGYWADAKASEVEYLPEPPETIEEGPNIAAPSADHIWSPGCWVWHQSRYAWRPGYWVTAQPNWVWIPAHYVWSPRGYVFVDSYYDYSVARRGIVFAPVYFSSNIYSRRGFSYSPLTVIHSSVFSSHLFLRPSYGHYYFGDYYGSSYASLGFSPWFSFYSGRHGYDPFYAHQRWHHRNDRQWDRRVEADFARRRDNEGARPPRTWTALQERSKTIDDQSLVVAGSLDDLAKSEESPIRLQPVATEERRQYSQRREEFRTSREERRKLEAAAQSPATDAPAKAIQPVKVKLPRTPIVAQPVDRLGQDDAPPKAIEAPQPDAKVEPKSRRPRDKAQLPREPKSPKEEPRPERPKAEPRPARPKAEPSAPKVEPRPERPKVEPRPERPKVEPRPERPKGKPNREPARAPKGGSDDRPKGGSKDSPKGEGKNSPRN